ncbi:MAG: hypothetical protein HQL59_02870 [Magnetococcales bacterium]|nr:hypothetical protein [Magnetococcales bacterium]
MNPRVALQRLRVPIGGYRPRTSGGLGPDITWVEVASALAQVVESDGALLLRAKYGGLDDSLEPLREAVWRRVLRRRWRCRDRGTLRRFSELALGEALELREDASASDRARARAIQVDPATWRETWKPRLELMLEELDTLEYEALCTLRDQLTELGPV